MTDALTRDLVSLLGADAVSHDDADRSAYAHDLWPRQLLATRGGFPRPEGPRAVVWPRDDAQLAALVTMARTHGVSLLPFGAGSGVVGATSAGRDTVSVDMKRMAPVRALDRDAGTLTVDTGALGEHLERWLQRRGATLGHFPSSIYCSTVGGWVATRGAGQCSGRYGKIEDMVLGVEGVLGTGEAFHAGAPRSGAVDARALLVGSEGTFGFLTRATLRVWPRPTAFRGVAYTFHSLREAWDAMRGLYQSGLRPAVTRLYDPFDTYVFLQGHDKPAQPRPARAAVPKLPSTLAESVLRWALDRPKPLNALLDLATEHVYTRSLLIVGFEITPHDDEDALVAAARAVCAEAGGRDEGDGPARRWLSRRHAVSYRQPPTYAQGLWVDTMEVAAPWSRLDALHTAVREALGHGGFVMAHFSHAYPDGCSIYFTFAGASPTDAAALETYDATWRRALAAAHAAGGTVAHHHGVGALEARRDGPGVGRRGDAAGGPARGGRPGGGDAPRRPGARRRRARRGAAVARRDPRGGCRVAHPHGPHRRALRRGAVRRRRRGDALRPRGPRHPARLAPRAARPVHAPRRPGRSSRRGLAGPTALGCPHGLAAVPATFGRPRPSPPARARPTLRPPRHGHPAALWRRRARPCVRRPGAHAAGGAQREPRRVDRPGRRAAPLRPGPGRGMSFRLEAPETRGNAVVVEVPHAGLVLPADTLATLQVDARTVLRDADAYVDQLYAHSPRAGATLLVAECSRYVVDLNRRPDDLDGTAVEGVGAPRGWFPRGVIWRETGDGTLALRRRLTRAEFDQRMALYYAPYHAALSAQMVALHRRHGRALLLAAHSMPSTDRVPGAPATVTPRRRADIVPGSLGRTTAHPALVDAVEQHFRAAGLSVRHDDPYRGGATTAHWGRPSEGFHAVQVEINRALYMDEATGAPRPDGMAFLTGLCTQLVTRLGVVLDALRE